MTHLVLRQDHNGVATLTINRPEKLNALTVDMGEQFTNVIAELNGMEDLRYN